LPDLPPSGWGLVAPAESPAPLPAVIGRTPPHELSGRDSFDLRLRFVWIWASMFCLFWYMFDCWPLFLFSGLFVLDIGALSLPDPLSAPLLNRHQFCLNKSACSSDSGFQGLRAHDRQHKLTTDSRSSRQRAEAREYSTSFLLAPASSQPGAKSN